MHVTAQSISTDLKFPLDFSSCDPAVVRGDAWQVK
jgi:hypothetical protein